ncbi:L-rhamnonate dehydratase [Alloacidobacterium dinghuense]|uniref:L-rhamnonate dehydratase n=1 Tax=Alloacidobacterium dinghuense TaxID=2763107 RepID=A0A7G8BLX2_9BACT|nr:L-rhamnonate dehydratase [Alloacidobacterium dinghuense]QNI33542.1 L-rhamnonate dehydratase [Alloacidobacterium dinghuense]
MKITEVRTRVVEWRGQTVPPQPHFCTNPMDLLQLPADSMAGFRFHGWLIVEIFTDSGHVGIGNAALAPRITKQVIDTYLKPVLIGKDPFDTEFLWQHMYRLTMAFGRKGIGMVAISAIDIAIWDLLGKAINQPVFRLLGGRTKQKVPVYASRLYSQPLDDLAKEAQQYKDRGYKAMKLRFGWGPTDGAAGMQRNVELLRTVREVIGYEIDLMADAYMGWTLDYAQRMLPLIEPFQLRWLEEPVIPDDIGGYAVLKVQNRVPIAGGEHEFTIYGFRQMLEAKALDYIQFDTNRVGGISQARKIAALAEAYSVPVIPHAGQMHNYHIVMASLNSPMAEYFPPVDVEIGNELFWYIFDGEPKAKDGYIDLNDDLPGLGLMISEESLKRFEIIE